MSMRSSSHRGSRTVDPCEQQSEDGGAKSRQAQRTSNGDYGGVEHGGGCGGG